MMSSQNPTSVRPRVVCTSQTATSALLAARLSTMTSPAPSRRDDSMASSPRHVAAMVDASPAVRRTPRSEAHTPFDSGHGTAGPGSRGRGTPSSRPYSTPWHTAPGYVSKWVGDAHCLEQRASLALSPAP